MKKYHGVEIEKSLFEYRRDLSMRSTEVFKILSLRLLNALLQLSIFVIY